MVGRKIMRFHFIYAHKCKCKNSIFAFTQVPLASTSKCTGTSSDKAGTLWNGLLIVIRPSLHDIWTVKSPGFLHSRSGRNCSISRTHRERHTTVESGAGCRKERATSQFVRQSCRPTTLLLVRRIRQSLISS